VHKPLSIDRFFCVAVLETHQSASESLLNILKFRVDSRRMPQEDVDAGLCFEVAVGLFVGWRVNNFVLVSLFQCYAQRIYFVLNEFIGPA
jgi:hypothetical protein